jgi:hypothetical protein
MAQIRSIYKECKENRQELKDLSRKMRTSHSSESFQSSEVFLRGSEENGVIVRRRVRHEALRIKEEEQNQSEASPSGLPSPPRSRSPSSRSTRRPPAPSNLPPFGPSATPSSTSTMEMVREAPRKVPGPRPHIHRRDQEWSRRRELFQHTVKAIPIQGQSGPSIRRTRRIIGSRVRDRDGVPFDDHGEWPAGVGVSSVDNFEGQAATQISTTNKNDEEVQSRSKIGVPTSSPMSVDAAGGEADPSKRADERQARSTTPRSEEEDSGPYKPLLPFGGPGSRKRPRRGDPSPSPVR